MGAGMERMSTASNSNSEDSEMLSRSREDESSRSEEGAVAAITSGTTMGALDWPGRLLAAMQQQSNNQSLFSQDETVFALQAHAKQAQAAAAAAAAAPPRTGAELPVANGAASASGSTPVSWQNCAAAAPSSETRLTNGLQPSAASLPNLHGCASAPAALPASVQNRVETAPAAAPIPEHSSVVLSGAALTLQSQTDWQAAFGLKPSVFEPRSLTDTSSASSTVVDDLGKRKRTEPEKRFTHVLF